MRTLEQLRREGSMALWHDYELGHANDLSGNGNDGTLVNSPQFSRQGLLIELYSAQAVQVAHSTSINLLTQTVVILARQNRVQTTANSFAKLASKNDASTLCWSLFFNEGANAIQWQSDGGGGVTVFWAPSRGLDGVYCYGFGMENGQASPNYYDGEEADAAASGAGAILQANTPLAIGNNVGGSSRGFGGVISSFLIFNKLLSATEHAQVYGELMKTRRGVLS